MEGAMTKKFAVAAAAVLALLAAADPAHAATIEWNMTDVSTSFSGPGTGGIDLSGYFNYDTVANSGGSPDGWSPISNYNITETGLQPTPVASVCRPSLLRMRV
jgi:hypothetical protein